MNDIKFDSKHVDFYSLIVKQQVLRLAIYIFGYLRADPFFVMPTDEQTCIIFKTESVLFHSLAKYFFSLFILVF